MEIFQGGVPEGALFLYHTGPVKEELRARIKRSVLCYLLQYQHYNAEFTEAERRRLGYPAPLYVPLSPATYLRSDGAHLLALAAPWIQRVPAFRERADSLIITNSLFFRVVRLFCPAMNSLPRKEILLSDLTPRGVPPHLFEGQRPNSTVLCCLQIPGVDCLWVWGVKVRGGGRLEWQSRHQLPLGRQLSILNKAGAIPDRMALHAFLTHRDNLRFFDPVVPRARCFDQSAAVAQWRGCLDQIRDYTFPDRPGAELYRNAILLWEEKIRSINLQNRWENFALLLQSEVMPWITSDGDVSKWAKAYSSLCAIVMQLFEIFPAPHNLLDQNIKQKFAYLDLEMDVRLFPYGMSAAFSALQQFLPEVREEEAVVASTSHHYFETTLLLQERGAPFQFKQVNFLDDIRDFSPDIVITDIHPNNATQAELNRNDVAGWVTGFLDVSDREQLNLILDTTLTNLSDPDLQQLLQDLKPDLILGRLRISIVQSLAKLLQHGADNFSGGIQIDFLPTSRQEVIDPPTNKTTFFGVLLEPKFQEVTDRYFSLVRKNTAWVYDCLASGFAEIERVCLDIHDGYYASVAHISFNGDDSTVYVAIRFDELIRQKLTSAKKTYDLLLELAALRGLPMTGRPSFGFPLCNITEVPGGLRLSVGIEDPITLQRQVDLILDYFNLLAHWVRRGIGMQWSEFCAFSKDAMRNLDAFEGRVELEEVESDYQTIGEATIRYADSKLSVTLFRRDQQPLHLAERELYVEPDVRYEGHRAHLIGYYLAIVDQVPLLLTREYDLSGGDYEGWEIICLRERGGFKKGGRAFWDDEETGAVFHLDPFTLNYKGERYTGNQVLVCDASLGVGGAPFSMSRLPAAPSLYDAVLDKLFLYKLSFETREDDSILLSFGDPRFLNYQEELTRRGLFNFQEVAHFLNHLPHPLPLPHFVNRHNWRFVNPFYRLCREIGEYGAASAGEFKGDQVDQIWAIDNQEFQKHLVTGLVDGLCNRMMQGVALSRKVAAQWRGFVRNERVQSLFSSLERKQALLRTLCELDNRLSYQYSGRPIPDLTRFQPYLDVLFCIINSEVYVDRSGYQTNYIDLVNVKMR